MERVRKKQGSYRGKTYARQENCQDSRSINGDGEKKARKQERKDLHKARETVG